MAARSLGVRRGLRRRYIKDPQNKLSLVVHFDHSDDNVRAGSERFLQRELGPRSAHGLQHATNRNMITMRMHDGLHVRNATVRVVYLDRNVHGIWSLGVNGKTVLTVTCKGTGRWVAAEARIDVVDGGDVLTIWSPDRKDSVFSLLEVYSQ